MQLKQQLINQGRRQKQYDDEDNIKKIFVDVMTKDEFNI